MVVFLCLIGNISQLGVRTHVELLLSWITCAVFHFGKAVVSAVDENYEQVTEFQGKSRLWIPTLDHYSSCN